MSQSAQQSMTANTLPQKAVVIQLNEARKAKRLQRLNRLTGLQFDSYPISLIHKG